MVVVTSASLEVKPDLLAFRLEASHFLWRMVRRLTGTLVRVGLGEVTLDQWRSLLNGDQQGFDIAAWTAPASGLFLESVAYPGSTARTRIHS